MGKSSKNLDGTKGREITHAENQRSKTEINPRCTQTQYVLKRGARQVIRKYSVIDEAKGSSAYVSSENSPCLHLRHGNIKQSILVNTVEDF